MMRAQDGKTPLHMATETDVAAVVSALLDAGVDVNAKDKVMRDMHVLLWLSASRAQARCVVSRRVR